MRGTAHARIIGLLPRNKPELWDHALVTLQRRARARLGQLTSSAWGTQAQRVRLAYGDLEMDVVPNKFVHNAIYLYGIHEYPATLFVLHWVQPRGTFVDVGANIGYFTLLAARRAGALGRVLAFEPLDGLRSQLEDHLRLNNLQHVQVRREALSNQAGTATLYETPWALNEGLGSLIARPEGNGTPHLVPTITLDSLRDSIGPGALVKIDVEGAEHLVLEGAQQWLRSTQGPALLFECDKPQVTIPAIEAAGYAVFSLQLNFMAGLAFEPWRTASSTGQRAHEAPNYVAVKTADLHRLDHLKQETAWPSRFST